MAWWRCHGARTVAVVPRLGPTRSARRAPRWPASSRRPEPPRPPTIPAARVEAIRSQLVPLAQARDQAIRERVRSSQCGALAIHGAGDPQRFGRARWPSDLTVRVWSRCSNANCRQNCRQSERFSIPSREIREMPRQMSGAKGTRTPDPHTASVVRYQLRHSPVKLCSSKLHHLR